MRNPKNYEVAKMRHLAMEQRDMNQEMIDEDEESREVVAKWNELLTDGEDADYMYLATNMFLAGVTFGYPGDEDFDGFGSWTDDIGQDAPEEDVRPHAFDAYTLMGRYSLEYCYVGAAEKYVSRLVDKDNDCKEVADSRFNSDDLNKCCLASVKVAGVTDQELELPHHGCYLYEKLQFLRWTQVSITEGMACGLLGEIKVDGRKYDNKRFDLIRCDAREHYLYVYKHDFDWLLITVNP